MSGPFLFLGSGNDMNNYSLSEAKLVNSNSSTTGYKFCFDDNG